VADYTTRFGPFDGRAWLNCAHQGPLPRPAVEAARAALADKIAPHRMRDEAFAGAPARLRRALARLIGAQADDIILGNSTSHGLHLVANGLPWKAGDEVLLVDGDFPASVLPWVALEARGVKARFVPPRGGAVDSGDFAAALSPATRVACVTWVSSFTGHALDLDAIGRVCRARGVALVVNASQALGARTLDVGCAPVDAVSGCGFKWLCGPYGTGFCWVRPELRATLEPQQHYWLAHQANRPLDRMQALELRPAADLGAAAFDVFCPASFLNVEPWTAALELLLDLGPDAIARHDDGLVARLVAGLDPARYRLISPASGPARSTLVVFTHVDSARNPAIVGQLHDAGVDVALREGNIRVSPHLYNTDDDIDRALAVLNR